MKELLLRIRALLIRFAGRGADNPLAPAAAVALSLLGAGDYYAAGPALTPLTDELPGDAPLEPADPMLAAGAACAQRRRNEGGVAVALAEESERLYEAVGLAVRLNLPLVLLVNCREASLDELSSRVMAADMECMPADGRSVMKLMPALRLAVDKAREGDGPTLIECVCDRPLDDEDTPADPLERLNNVLILEGYAMPEELQ
ncbi:MAG: hypothetical protein J5602_04065 [Clostridia bacterium]|nr:hypothetical protein [Clostridia bacterium]